MSTFAFKDKEIFYTWDGEKGKPVLCILNGIMMSHKSWDAFIPTLSNHFRILRLDFLDQGLSSKMDEPYTQRLQVEMLKALFDHLALEKVHLVGISYGGSIALQFAERHPRRLDRMILFNAAARTTPWLRDIGRGWNRVARSGDGEAYYHVTIPYIYSPHFYTRRIEWMENRKETLLPVFESDAFRQAMIRLTDSAEGHDVYDNLPAIQVKTLVVAAEDDYLTPPYQQKEIASRMPDATYLMFPECGHASMYEKPELFVTSIIGFLSDSTDEYDIA